MKHIGWVPVCVKGFELGVWPSWFSALKQVCMMVRDEHPRFKFKFVKVFIEEKKNAR